MNDCAHWWYKSDDAGLCKEEAWRKDVAIVVPVVAVVVIVIVVVTAIICCRKKRLHVQAGSTENTAPSQDAPAEKTETKMEPVVATGVEV